MECRTQCQIAFLKHLHAIIVGILHRCWQEHQQQGFTPELADNQDKPEFLAE